MVEGSGLENRQAFTRLVGSNPTLSANVSATARSAAFEILALSSDTGRPSILESAGSTPSRGPRDRLSYTAQPLRGEVAEWLKARPC